MTISHSGLLFGHPVCAASQKTRLMLITSRNIDRFSKNSFTTNLRTNFTTIWSLHIPPNLKYVAAIPCETEMCRKSYKFKNTVLKTLFWSIFCRYTHFIFSLQTKVSIKLHKISFYIKYSVRDLICDVHFCAWVTMLQYA